MSMKSKISIELYNARMKISEENGVKYTQRDVALAVKITEQYYQRIESGKSQPLLELHFKLCKCLHIDTNIFKEEVEVDEIKPLSDNKNKKGR